MPSYVVVALCTSANTDVDTQSTSGMSTYTDCITGYSHVADCSQSQQLHNRQWVAVDISQKFAELASSTYVALHAILTLHI